MTRVIRPREPQAVMVTTLVSDIRRALTDTAAERRPMIHVLEADPDLGASISGEEWQAALRAAAAPLIDHPRGPLRFGPSPDRGALGMLVLGGILALRHQAGERAYVELLGEGDVIRTWTSAEATSAPRPAVSACVISELSLALLDRAFALRTERWPEIHAALIQRVITRSRRLSLQAAINAIPHMEERVELTLWQLAYRFGKVTSRGLKLPVRLSHHHLAEIVGARRPSVSTALARLESTGRVVRNRPDEWLLPGPEPWQLAPLTRQSVLTE